jgi:hypothetical protein
VMRVSGSVAVEKCLDARADGVQPDLAGDFLELRRALRLLDDKPAAKAAKAWRQSFPVGLSTRLGARAVAVDVIGLADLVEADPGQAHRTGFLRREERVVAHARRRVIAKLFLDLIEQNHLYVQIRAMEWSKSLRDVAMDDLAIFHHATAHGDVPRSARPDAFRDRNDRRQIVGKLCRIGRIGFQLRFQLTVGVFRRFEMKVWCFVGHC